MKNKMDNLPFLDPSKYTFIEKNPNINSNRHKITIQNYQNKEYLAQTPLISRNILFRRKLGKNSSYFNSKNNRKNFESNYSEDISIIKRFLCQKINHNKYLKPIKQLSKSGSSININPNKNNVFQQNNGQQTKNIGKIKNYKNLNITQLLFNKYSKDTNLIHISNMKKYLMKDKENDTNGNFLYDDENEEKKESITFIIKDNNSKQYFKKNLTKKYRSNNNNKSMGKEENNFDFIIKGKRFNSPSLRNIKSVKYMKDMRKNVKYRDSQNSKERKNSNEGKYDYMLKNKIKKMREKINSEGQKLKGIDNLMLKCYIGAQNQFLIDSKNIFGNLIQ